MDRDSPWRQVVESPSPGDHIILWSDASPACDHACASFLRGGLSRNDLILVALPKTEFPDLETRLVASGVDLEALVNEGRALRILSDEVTPDNARDLEGIPAVMPDVLDLAKSMGRTGLTVFDRTAAARFEAGDFGLAERIEHLGRENRHSARVLCAYDGRRLSFDRLREGVRITRQHTHAVTSLGAGRFFVESLARLVEV